MLASPSLACEEQDNAAVDVTACCRAAASLSLCLASSIASAGAVSLAKAAAPTKRGIAPTRSGLALRRKPARNRFKANSASSAAQTLKATAIAKTADQP